LQLAGHEHELFYLIDSADSHMATNGFWVNRKDGFHFSLPTLAQRRRYQSRYYAIGARLFAMTVIVLVIVTVNVTATALRLRLAAPVAAPGWLRL
jgi:hypothetical protein